MDTSTISSRLRAWTMSNARRAVLFGLGMLAMVVLIPGVPASAAGYPVKACADIAVSTVVPFPGQHIQVTGSNFAPHQTVTLVLHSPTVTLAQTTADGSGSFSIQVTIPESPVGPRLLTATGVAGNCPAIAVRLIVTPLGVSPISHGPSATGTNIEMGLVVGLALIATGLMLARSGRARSRQRASY